MDEREFKQGDRVRFTAEQLGTIRKDGPGTKFTEITVGAGDEGTVELVDALLDGWIAITPDGHDELYVPAHPSMVEPVS